MARWPDPLPNMVEYAVCPLCVSLQPELHYCPVLNGCEVILAPFYTDSSMTTV